MTRRGLISTGLAAGLGALPGLSGSVKAAGLLSARAAGFRMPLESVPHERTFMQWPARPSLYGSKTALEAVRGKVVLIAQAIARFEPVVVLAQPKQIALAREALGAKVDVWPIETEDLWCRDSGPAFVRSAKGELALSELNFNGWGNKQGHTDDGLIVKRVAKRLDLPVFDNGVVGEGGGVEVDGEGTALAHESSWVNSNRNTKSKAEVERLLLDALGAEHMIWAPGVKGADITDCHIDAVARFVKPGQVLIQLPKVKDRSDPWSVSALETYEVLKTARDAKDRKLDIVVVNEPNANRIRSQKADFVSCYPNYYVCNGAVIGAEFGDDKADADAKSILQQLYPGREVVSLNIDPIGEAGGGIHCATQQQPAQKA